MTEIWDALRAAAETDNLGHAQAIIDGAGIIVESADLTVCYDERGDPPCMVTTMTCIFPCSLCLT